MLRYYCYSSFISDMHAIAWCAVNMTHWHTHIHEPRGAQLQVCYCPYSTLIMVALWNRADHYIFMLWFVLLLLLFFLA